MCDLHIFSNKIMIITLYTFRSLYLLPLHPLLVLVCVSARWRAQQQGQELGKVKPTSLPWLEPIRGGSLRGPSSKGHVYIQVRWNGHWHNHETFSWARSGGVAAALRRPRQFCLVGIVEYRKVCQKRDTHPQWPGCNNIRDHCQEVPWYNKDLTASVDFTTYFWAARL